MAKSYAHQIDDEAKINYLSIAGLPVTMRASLIPYQ